MVPLDAPLDRRAFLAAAATLAAGGLAGRRLAAQLAVPQSGLIVLSGRPLNAESPLAALGAYHTHSPRRVKPRDGIVLQFRTWLLPTKPGGRAGRRPPAPAGRPTAPAGAAPLSLFDTLPSCQLPRRSCYSWRPG